MPTAKMEREPIEVIAAYMQTGMRPLRFRKGGRVYVVRAVHLVHHERQGREKWTYYSVSDGTGTYRLAHASEAAAWYLETVPHL